MKKNPEIKKWIAELRKQRTKVGKVRDELREAISEMEALEDCSDRAWQDIDSAIDALSELA